MDLSSFISILPNLSIGVVSIGALVYVINKFLIELAAVRKQHEASMQNREQAYRDLEKEVRQDIMKHLSESTKVISSNAHIMERVMRHLDNHV